MSYTISVARHLRIAANQGAIGPAYGCQDRRSTVRETHAPKMPARQYDQDYDRYSGDRENLAGRYGVSARAASTPGSSIHLFAGQNISLRTLLNGLLLRSGNDAAVAIAEHLAGSVDEFANRMNEKAIALGIVNSHFSNPHGLHAVDHYSRSF